MSGKVWWLCSGLAGGVVLTLVAHAFLKPPEPVARIAAERRAVARVSELLVQNEQLEDSLAGGRARETDLAAKVEELTKCMEEMEKAGQPAQKENPEPDAAPAELTDEVIMEEVRAFAPALRSIILGQGGDEARDKLRALFARDPKRVVKFLADQFDDDTGDIGMRTVIAHALAQSGDPGAIKALDDTLSDPDTGMIEHRFASHGLAFSDADGVVPILSRVAHDEAEDMGARANASFGLARRDLDEGFEVYLAMTDRALEKGDPAGLQYLGGLTLLSKKANPYMRERLLRYDESQALLLLIEVLKRRGDQEAVPNLEKLAYDSSRPESVQKSAQAALKALQEKQ